jgi:hypothetical protein
MGTKAIDRLNQEYICARRAAQGRDAILSASQPNAEPFLDVFELSKAKWIAIFLV